jgi:CelD/BcsL family acetyltransferase involved in cellulose biosynthesis
MIRTYPELGPLVGDWDRLALTAGSPFLTHEWLNCWCSAFGRGDPIWLVLQDRDGSLRAGACLQSMKGKGLASAADELSGDWDVVARDESAREELWAAIVERGASRIHLQGMPEHAAGTRFVCEELGRSGYRTVRKPGPFSPWLALPTSWEEMIESVSRKLRAEIKHRRRMLEREGPVTFRTVSGGSTLAEDLERFLKLEASGWKGRSGTSILGNSSAESLYLGFARAAAERGWLRLHLLELNGVPIAIDYSCAFGGRGVFIKAGFDEAYRRMSPGTLLLAETLRRCIEEGLHSCDFLGETEHYKRRWTSEVHPREQIWAYRREALPGYVYRKRARPLLKSVRDRAIAIRGLAIPRSSDAGT